MVLVGWTKADVLVKCLVGLVCVLVGYVDKGVPVLVVSESSSSSSTSYSSYVSCDVNVGDVGGIWCFSFLVSQILSWASGVKCRGGLLAGMVVSDSLSASFVVLNMLAVVISFEILSCVSCVCLSSSACGSSLVS